MSLSYTVNVLGKFILHVNVSDATQIITKCVRLQAAIGNFTVTETLLSLNRHIIHVSSKKQFFWEISECYIVSIFWNMSMIR